MLLFQGHGLDPTSMNGGGEKLKQMSEVSNRNLYKWRLLVPKAIYLAEF